MGKNSKRNRKLAAERSATPADAKSSSSTTTAPNEVDPAPKSFLVRFGSFIVPILMLVAVRLVFDATNEALGVGSATFDDYDSFDDVQVTVDPVLITPLEKRDFLSRAEFSKLKTDVAELVEASALDETDHKGVSELTYGVDVGDLTSFASVGDAVRKLIVGDATSFKLSFLIVKPRYEGFVEWRSESRKFASIDFGSVAFAPSVITFMDVSLPSHVVGGDLEVSDAVDDATLKSFSPEESCAVSVNGDSKWRLRPFTCGDCDAYGDDEARNDRILLVVEQYALPDGVDGFSNAASRDPPSEIEESIKERVQRIAVMSAVSFVALTAYNRYAK